VNVENPVAWGGEYVFVVADEDWNEIGREWSA